MLTFTRDTEDSAPAEFPPDQPEADIVEDDGAAYGAEEVELEEGLKAELAAEEAKDVGEDEEMAGVEDTTGAKEKAEDDEDSDAVSEDLEAESSGSDDEEEGEEEEGEGEGEEDMDMGEGHAGPSEEKALEAQRTEVMVH